MGYATGALRRYSRLGPHEAPVLADAGAKPFAS